MKNILNIWKFIKIYDVNLVKIQFYAPKNAFYAPKNNFITHWKNFINEKIILLMW